MSLEKSIQSGREKRKPYRSSGQFDRTCRPHGRCPYCASNRRHPQAKAALGAAEQLYEHATAEDQSRRDQEEALWESFFADAEHVVHDEFIVDDPEAYAAIAERISKESNDLLATEDYLFEE